MMILLRLWPLRSSASISVTHKILSFSFIPDVFGIDDEDSDSDRKRIYIFENTARTDYFRVNSVEKQKLSELLLKKLFEELLIWWTFSLADLSKSRTKSSIASDSPFYRYTHDV